LPTTYNTISGDTFEKISRKKYGVSDGPLIQGANPAISEPIPPGTTLVIPDQPSAPKDQTSGTEADNPDELAVIVGGEAFKYWESVSVTRTVDQMDTFSLTAPTTPVFKPLSYDSVAITVGGSPLFTGTMLGVNPTVTASRQTDEVDGYSLPGVLNDCTMPSSAYPLNEMRNQTLAVIAASILRPFGLLAVFTASAGAAFDIVAIGEGEKVLAFLTNLAKQNRKSSYVLSQTSQTAQLSNR